MINIIFVLVMLIFLSQAFNAIAGEQTYVDAPALYKKHCSACHPNASVFRSQRIIMRSVTNPPPGMPKFDEDRISKNSMKALVDYILHGNI